MTNEQRHAGCLDANTMAEYIDGTLEPRQRAEVEAHLAECEECYEVFEAALRAGTRYEETQAVNAKARWRQLWLVAASIAAIGVSSALAYRAILSPSAQAKRQLAALEVAVGGSRPILARTSARFAWGERNVTRGEAASLPVTVQGPAVRLRELGTRSTDPIVLRGSALSQLVAGDYSGAVATLELGLESSPTDANLHLDLSAALIERASREQSKTDALRASNEAALALRLDDNSASARFNFALALELMGDSQSAIDAWGQFVAREIDEHWRAEGQAHLDALRLKRSQASAEIEPFSLPSGRGLEVSPVTALELALVRLLTKWAERDFVEGTQITAAIELTSESLKSRGFLGASTALADSVRGTKGDGNSGSCLRRLVIAFGNWRRLFDSGDRSGAANQAITISEQLQCAQVSPDIGAVPKTWQLISQGRTVEARRLAQSALLVAQRTGKRQTEMLIYEALGAIALDQTRYSDAVAERERALKIASAIGDHWAEGRLHTQLGETADEEGDRESAWRHFGAALEALDSGVPISQQYSTLATVTIAAGHAKFAHTASILAGRMGSAANILGRPGPRVMALLQSSRADVMMGDISAAEAALRQAGQIAAGMPAGRFRDAWLAEVNWIAGVVLAAGHPSDAISKLSKAIDHFSAIDRPFRLAELLMHRGRLYRTIGSTTDATIDFERGIAVLEDQRPAIREEQLRISRSSEVFGLFQDLIDVVSDNAASALLAADRAKARELHYQTAAPLKIGTSLKELTNCLGDSTAVVAYATLPNRVLRWIVAGDQLTMDSLPVDAHRLERLSSGFVEELQLDRDLRDGRELASRLWSADSIAPNKRVIVVADGPLARIPFGALPMSDGAFLVQSTQISTAPSLRSLCTLGPDTGGTGRRALLVGASIGVPEKQLPPLIEVDSEVRKLATIYDRPTTLLGPLATVLSIQQAISRSQIVHFGGHAFLDEVTPAKSALVTVDFSHSGGLTAPLIADLHLVRGCVVILAACKTAVGRYFDGEGPLSLARQFLAAGASSVLASLWNVKDGQAKQFVLRVHRKLADGATLAEATNATQRELIRAGTSTSAWSGYTITGGLAGSPSHGG